MSLIPASILSGNIVPRSSLFDLDRFFENTLSPAQQSSARQSAFAPRVDVKEREAAFEISAELPGVAKQDIQVTLEDGVLTIQAESRQEDVEEKDGRVIRQERRYGKFARSFELGKQVHEGDITASFNNGILTLVAPKHQVNVNSPRKIDVA